MKKVGSLFVLLIVFLGCKKDKEEPRTFKGVVLRRHDQKPIANAQVNLGFIRKTDQYSLTPILYTATTDVNGEYTISAADMGTEPHYGAYARKGGFKQMAMGQRRPIRDQAKDTIILDDASYLKIDLVLKTFPPPQNGITPLMTLDWGFMNPTTGWYETQQVPYGKSNTYGPPYATDNYLDSFSYVESKKALIRLYTQGVATPKFLLEKEVILDSLKTTLVKIEY
jgi:hypothetical protein